MREVELELSVGDVIKCGNYIVTVVDIEGVGVSMEVVTQHNTVVPSNFVTPPNGVTPSNKVAKEPLTKTELGFTTNVTPSRYDLLPR